MKALQWQLDYRAGDILFKYISGICGKLFSVGQLAVYRLGRGIKATQGRVEISEKDEQEATAVRC